MTRRIRISLFAVAGLLCLFVIGLSTFFYAEHRRGAFLLLAVAALAGLALFSWQFWFYRFSDRRNQGFADESMTPKIVMPRNWRVLTLTLVATLLVVWLLESHVSAATWNVIFPLASICLFAAVVVRMQQRSRDR
jgi:uncharacterized membrane-anchored protein